MISDGSLLRIVVQLRAFPLVSEKIFRGNGGEVACAFFFYKQKQNIDKSPSARICPQFNREQQSVKRSYDYMLVESICVCVHLRHMTVSDRNLERWWR
jgi:hypothetical protein